MYIAIRSKEDCSEALEVARRYSPNIEIVDETTLVFDLTGNKVNEAARIAKEISERFVAVGVAGNLAAALLLARWGRGGFKVQGSRFKVCRAESIAEESSSDEQNLERETLNSPGGVAGTKFKVQSSDKQTLNLEPGTSNQSHRLNQSSPDKQTWNLKHETWNSLPLESISGNRDFLELMDSWAIHNLGEFSQLPEDEMVERFGLDIIELRKQARGEAFRAVNWNVQEDKFFWAKDLEGGIETIEPLNFVLTKGVEQIFQNLDHVGLSTQSAKITLRGRKKKKLYRIRIVFPTKNQKIWIRQIVTKIELDAPPFNIDRIEIEFRATKPRTVQNNLYSGAILEPENLNLIVSKLKKVVGLQNIGLPKLRDSWSEGFYMTEDLSPLIKDFYEEPESDGIRSTFYYLPQAIKARVFFEGGEPKALIIKGKRELVRTSGGPWRKDAEWYRAKGWKRDEWDIETESGAIYRVFTDKNGEAFVDGGYD